MSFTKHDGKEKLGSWDKQKTYKKGQIIQLVKFHSLISYRITSAPIATNTEGYSVYSYEIIG